MEGSKTAVYCRQHADDGMVDVCKKRCSHDSCTKVPTFNFQGSRTSAYCKQHAEDGMVDITNKHCSHDLCTRRPSFDVEGSKTATYCKKHAEDGMVNVRTSRFSNVSRKAVPRRGMPNDVETSAGTMLTTELSGDSRIHGRNRSR